MDGQTDRQRLLVYSAAFHAKAIIFACVFLCRLYSYKKTFPRKWSAYVNFVFYFLTISRSKVLLVEDLVVLPKDFL